MVINLGLYYPQGHEAHAEIGHIERPERVESIKSALLNAGYWDDKLLVQSIAPPEDVLSGIHTHTYLDLLKRFCEEGRSLDEETYTTPASWNIALNTAGGAIAIVDKVWQGEIQRGFALTRPPGHHAVPGLGMGFCLLNNIAIAAEYLIKKRSVKRLAIVDLDLHHGNGTQKIFWERGDVFYFSTHEWPNYPGTGEMTETGEGEGVQRTANFPLPPGSGDKAFSTILYEVIIPLIDHYGAEMVLVSCGFDPHWRDPLGHLLLSAKIYGELIKALVGWVDNHASGKIALFLEGGYDLDACAACGEAVVAALLGKPFTDPLGPSPKLEGSSWNSVYSRAKEIWSL
jgi:acetoin utilization deacetylase AcuC-like enzyme